ncbi:hypothetical protein AB1A65_14395 [Muricauda sp. ANG21]|uniref:hypothetical protein n=1 Tax=Allomuricauda sp. ANG21 TaxID=3042468 RepID=UPI0034563E44
MKQNIYIKAMEIGFSKIGGISYLDLKKQIEIEMGSSMGRNTEAAFVKWIVDAFEPVVGFPRGLPNFILGVANYVMHGKSDSASRTHYDRFSNTIWVIKGATVKQYLDYQELVESREAAIKAKKQSNVSIGIALFALIVSSMLGLASLYSTQDVNLIEDKTKVERLEKENQQLNEELYKAEMMLKALGSDTTTNKNNFNENKGTN